MQVNKMDVRRPFYQGFGTVVTNVVIPICMGIFQVLLAVVDILEYAVVKIFKLLTVQIPNRKEVQVNVNLTEQNQQTDQSHTTVENRNIDTLSERYEQQSAARQEARRSRVSEYNDEESQKKIYKYKLLEDGLLDTIQQANIASQLISLQFSQEEAVEAARNCMTVDAAISYLNQQCIACSKSYTMNQMIYMLHCTHSFCRSCSKTFFSMQIQHHCVTDCICPLCRKPQLNTDEMSMYDIKDYLGNFSTLMRNVLDDSVYDMFQTKLSSFLNQNVDEKQAQMPICNVKLKPFCFVPFCETDNIQQHSAASVANTKITATDSLHFDEMERKAILLLAHGKVDQFPQAELAVTLMSLEYNETDSIEASKHCSNLDNALTYINQKCPKCNRTYTKNAMMAMLNCAHQLCMSCAKLYFTEQITDHDIIDCNCPECYSPDFDTEKDSFHCYLANLDIVLKKLLDPLVYEQFQQKLTSFTMENDSSSAEEGLTPLPADLVRQARQFLQEGRVRNVVQSEIAIRLIQAGHSEEDSLEAVKHCSTLNGAIAFLDQDCDLCADKFRMNQMVTMLSCEHRCCTDCAKNYFTVQINDKTIMDCNCPYCQLPNLADENMPEAELTYYFSNLDIMLKNILEPVVHDVFQKKIRDLSLTKLPNFKWCPRCSSGFIAEPGQLQVTCPSCRAISCIQCRVPWEDQHKGISCQRFAEWKAANNPQHQAAGLDNLLAEHGINCPKCKHRFSLTKGGCMHFTCSQCKHEFCQGCSKPFNSRCILPLCQYRGGLHAHHPRNCLFYLRDREPSELQALLRKYKVPFDTERPAGAVNRTTCSVVVQRITLGREEFCPNAPLAGHAGHCRLHYIEYLAGIIRTNRIDPVDEFDVTFITCEMQRRGIPVPKKEDATSPEAYKESCAKIVKEKIPLE